MALTPSPSVKCSVMICPELELLLSSPMLLQPHSRLVVVYLVPAMRYLSQEGHFSILVLVIKETPQSLFGSDLKLEICVET